MAIMAVAPENQSLLDGFVGVVVTSLGLLSSAIGVLLLPESLLSGLWFAAIGVNFLASVLVGTTAGRQRLGLEPDGTLTAMGFLMIAVILIVAFLLVDVPLA
ncbi:hypothetical protein [Haladaptatus sp. NG-WS-4]